MKSFIRIYIHTYIHTYIHRVGLHYVLRSIHTYIHTYILTYIQKLKVLSIEHTCIQTNKHYPIPEETLKLLISQSGVWKIRLSSEPSNIFSPWIDKVRVASTKGFPM